MRDKAEPHANGKERPGQAQEPGLEELALSGDLRRSVIWWRAMVFKSLRVSSFAWLEPFNNTALKPGVFSLEEQPGADRVYGLLAGCSGGIT